MVKIQFRKTFLLGRLKPNVVTFGRPTVGVEVVVFCNASLGVQDAVTRVA